MLSCPQLLHDNLEIVECQKEGVQPIIYKVKEKTLYLNLKERPGRNDSEYMFLKQVKLCLFINS